MASALIPLIPFIVSALSGAGAEFAKGKPGYDKLDILDPQQKSLREKIMQILGGGGQVEGPLGELQKMLSGDPESMKEFEAPLMRQFNEQIVPGLAERFSGAGAGAQRSSAFQQALSGAGADLTERLGSLRGQMKLQGLQGLMPLLQQAFAPSFAYQERDTSNPLSKILGAFGKAGAEFGGQITPSLTKKYWKM